MSNDNKRRKIKKQLAALMSFVLLLSESGMYAVDSDNHFGRISHIIKVAAENNDTGSTVKIDITNLEIKNGLREYIISENGKYEFSGSNYDELQHIYIPTKITVAADVTADIFFNGVHINNSDGFSCAVPPDSSGNIPEEKEATTPLDILDGADVRLFLMGDSELGINNNGKTVSVAQNAVFTLEESAYKLKISEQSTEYEKTGVLLDILGKFVMNGSHLLLEQNKNDIPFNLYAENDYFRDNPVGRIFINGGYFECDDLDFMYYNEGAYFFVNGGSFSISLDDNSGQYTDHCLDFISGLPADTEVSMIQLYYKNGKKIADYGVGNVRTSSDGKLIIDFGKQSALGLDFSEIYQSDGAAVTGIIKCGDKYYNLQLERSSLFSSDVVNVTEIDENKLYIMNFIDYSTGEELGTVYTTVDSDKKALNRYQEADGTEYSYYASNDSDIEFDFTLTDNEVDVYVKIKKIIFDVTVNGETSSQKYGTKLAESDNFIYVDSENQYWDGTVQGEISVSAYPCKTIEGVKYLLVQDIDDLNILRTLVESGLSDINVYIGADIDAGNFAGIGNKECPYIGKMLGNNHTITLNIEDTEETEARSFINYASTGFKINEIRTTGYVRSASEYCGGIIGYISGDAGCLINKCASDAVVVCLAEDYKGYYGGLVGYSYFSRLTNCMFNGSISGKPEYCSGFVGIGESTLSFDDCYLNTVFPNDSHITVNNYTYINEDLLWSITNCYILSNCDITVGYVETTTFKETAWLLNTKGYLENSKSWTYIPDKGIALADDENAPVFKITYDSGNAYNDDSFNTYIYTDCQGVNPASPELPEGFIGNGQTYEWFDIDNEVQYQENEKINSDITCGLIINDDNSYTVNFSGDLNCNINGFKYGCDINDLLDYEDRYIFICENGYRHTAFDGKCKSFKAYKLSYDNEQYTMHISDKESLKAFAVAVEDGMNCLNAVLENDIDISDDPDFTIGKSQQRSYSGTFDGKGHTITVDLLNNTDEFTCGLFGYLSEGAVIRNLMTTGCVKSNCSFCGGIVGCIQESSIIENCGSDVEFTSANEFCTFGGIAGILNDNGTANVQNSFFVGSSSAKQSGIVGICDGTASISNCFVDTEFNDVTGETFCGNSQNAQMTNCYYTNACGSSIQGTKISAEKMKTTEFAYNLNSTNGTSKNSEIWTYVKGGTHPVFADSVNKAVYRASLDYHDDADISGVPVNIYSSSEGKVVLPETAGGFRLEWKNINGNIVSGTQTIKSDTSFSSKYEQISGTVSIPENVKVSDTITAEADVSNEKTGNLQYQWYVLENDSKIKIENAVSDKYTIKDNDLGKKLVCEVYADNLKGVLSSSSDTVKCGGTAHYYNSAGYCKECGHIQNGVDAFVGMNAEVGGKIAMHFKIALSDKAVSDPDARMVFDFAGNEITVPLENAEKIEDAPGIYQFTLSLTSTQMDEDITAQMKYSSESLYTPGTAASVLKEYSVNKYLNNIQTDDDSTVNEVIKAMRNFGAYLDIYSGDTTEDVTPDTISMNSEDLEDLNQYEYSVTSSGSGIKAESVNLSIDSLISMNICFKAEGKINEYTATVDGKEVRLTSSGDFFCVNINSISPLNYNKTFTVILKDISDPNNAVTVQCSALSYINKQLNSEPNDALRNVCTAIYKYNRAVTAYCQECDPDNN